MAVAGLDGSDSNWEVMPGTRQAHAAATLCELGLICGTLAWQTGAGPAAWPGTLWERVQLAASTVPEAPGVEALLVILVCAVGGVTFGVSTGFLEWPRWPPPGRRVAALIGVVVTLFTPGIFEELIFRAALLPTAAAGGQAQACSPTLILIAFLIYHLDLGHQKAVFRDLRFLVLAGILGIACTWAYVGCGQSLWPPALLHGLVVWAWLFCMGGIYKVEGRWPGE